jgi:hypothetical protein
VQHSIGRLDRCTISLAVSFSLFNTLDDPDVPKTTRACALSSGSGTAKSQAGNAMAEKAPPAPGLPTTAGIESRLVPREEAEDMPTGREVPLHALWKEDNYTLESHEVDSLADELDSVVTSLHSSASEGYESMSKNEPLICSPWRYLHDLLAFTYRPVGLEKT